MTLQFVIPGIIKPYVRMTGRGKYVQPEALEYRASQAALRAAFALAMLHHEPLPGQTPLFVDILLRREHLHQRDADNEAKALLDSMNGIVYPDDRWIDDLHIRREVGEPEIIVEAGIL